MMGVGVVSDGEGIDGGSDVFLWRIRRRVTVGIAWQLGSGFCFFHLSLYAG